MGNQPGVDYSSWITPLQSALSELDISTPQRIAAFLAQVRAETGGLRKLREDIGPYRVRVLVDTFVSAYTDNGVSSEDRLKNPNKAAAGVTAREARFLNLKEFLRELGLVDLDDRSLSGAGVEDILVGSGGRWTEAMAKAAANRHYSSDVGNGRGLGNGTEAGEDGWNFIGRGFVHLTGRTNYEPFATYIQEKHPELVQTQNGRTVAETLLGNKVVPRAFNATNNALQ